MIGRSQYHLYFKYADGRYPPSGFPGVALLLVNLLVDDDRYTSTLTHGLTIVSTIASTTVSVTS